ncbi:relaxin receptor 2-like isoform X2 [Euwallacea fornicatus]|uniref:relaxin receptor 2-like isoform X2 n=1 Tax=Euwallacea fornicatus TaxID=995702 RepID=UPI00339012E5
MSNWREILLNGCIITGVVLISVFVYYYSKGECPKDTMACASGGFCISSKSVCNQEYDCPDKEDEDPVLCADLHGSSGLIENILNISLLSEDNQMEELCGIENYPKESCQCGFSTRIYCNEAGFVEIPQGISVGVSYLILSNNGIKTLGRNSLRTFNLTLLHMENNELDHIEPQAFAQQQFLQKLFLMNNKLRTLPFGTFTGLTNLEWLHIDNNMIQKIDFDNFGIMKKLKWLDMSHNFLSFEENEAFPLMSELVELFLNHNQIKYITNDTFNNLVYLDLLCLSSNTITAIEIGAFINLKRLKELNLDGNHLKTITPELFKSQKYLIKLSLGNNPLTYLNNELFTPLRNLRSLHLEDLEIANINTEMLKCTRALQWVYFQSYTYCTYAPSVPRCRPLSDGISSRDRLLSKPIFRYSNWIMCLITLSGNSLVLFGRFLFRDENKNLSIVIKNLAIGDSLMGVYLLIIAYHDLKYRDNYNEFARKWMSSWDCVITGMIGMTSLEVSVMFLVFLSLDRYFAITMPYKKHGSLNFKETWRVVFCIWCFGISVSVIPIVGFLSSTKFYGINGLCLPLYIDDPYLIGWQYSAIIFFGINAPSLLVIIYTYAGMFISIKNTRNATSIPETDCEFAIRFLFIVLANIACWLPIIIAKMVVYFKVDVTADVYGWLVVFILPINSSLNPILYTFTTRKYRSRIVNVPNCFMKITKFGGAHLAGDIFKISQKDISKSEDNS